jgi:hypothetical protein
MSARHPLDTDWFESTQSELEVLLSRLARAGLCFIVDYGHWQGVRMGLDEFLVACNLLPLIHIPDPIGRALLTIKAVKA